MIVQRCSKMSKGYANHKRGNEGVVILGIIFFIPFYPCHIKKTTSWFRNINGMQHQKSLWSKDWISQPVDEMSTEIKWKLSSHSSLHKGICHHNQHESTAMLTYLQSWRVWRLKTPHQRHEDGKCSEFHRNILWFYHHEVASFCLEIFPSPENKMMHQL